MNSKDIIRMIQGTEIVEKGMEKAYNDLKKDIEENREECEQLVLKYYGEEKYKRVVFEMEISTKLEFLTNAVLYKGITEKELKFISKELIKLGKEIIGE